MRYNFVFHYEIVGKSTILIKAAHKNHILVMKQLAIAFTCITLLSFSWACSNGDTIVTEDGLEITDIRVGTGEEAQAMDFLTIHFELSVESGEILESTYDRDEPIVVQVGSGQLPIQGWDQGMIGMRIVSAGTG